MSFCRLATTNDRNAKRNGYAEALAGTYDQMEDSRPFFDSLPENERPTKSPNGYYIENTDGKGQANQFFAKDKTTFFYTSMYI